MEQKFKLKRHPITKIFIQEEWKDISGFEGAYQISNYGRVKSLERRVYTKKGDHSHLRRERIMKSSPSPRGYLIVTFHNNGIPNWFSVHRLTAIYWVENPLNLPIVNHDDTDKLNNFYLNLIWCTSEQNSHHAIKNGRLGKLKFLNERKVIDILQNYPNTTIPELAKKHKVSSGTVRDVVVGNTYKEVTSKYLKNGSK